MRHSVDKYRGEFLWKITRKISEGLYYQYIYNLIRLVEDGLYLSEE